MKVKEFLSYLKKDALSIMNPTRDNVIVGDENSEVNKIAVCFNLSAKILDEAIAWGADTILTHEGVFGSINFTTQAIREYDQKKKDLLEKNGITVFRFHDHAHNREWDYIHLGFIKALGLDVEKIAPRTSFARDLYRLKTPMTVEELANLALKKLSLKLARLVGNREKVVKTLCLALGWTDLFNGNELHNPDCDLIISGEVGSELYCQYYMRDANYYGNEQALLLLGHIGAERAGMWDLSNELQEQGFNTKYFEESELYDNIFNE